MFEFWGGLILVVLVLYLFMETVGKGLYLVDTISWRFIKRNPVPPLQPAANGVAMAAPILLMGCFGWALEQLKKGKRLARSGWNGKNMWLLLQVPDDHSKMTLPYIHIEYPAGHPAYPNGSRVPWLAFQTDMLAEDWFVVE